MQWLTELIAIASRRDTADNAARRISANVRNGVGGGKKKKNII